MSINKAQGVPNMATLTRLLISRTYSKNSDIELLQKNGYDEDCAVSYMDGYIDGISYTLSMIYPNINFEEFIEIMIKNNVVDLAEIRPGTILASKKMPEYNNNLSVVLSVTRSPAGIYITATNLYNMSVYENAPRMEREYNIHIEALPQIYPQDFVIDLGTMFPINMDNTNIQAISDTFSIINQLSEKEITKLIHAFEEYDKEMGELYDVATGKINE